VPPAREETSKELARNKVRKTDNKLEPNRTRLKAEVRQRSQLNAKKLNKTKKKIRNTQLELKNKCCWTRL